MSTLPNTTATGTGTQPVFASKADITREVGKALAQFAGANTDAVDARQAAIDENNAAMGKREALIIALAGAARAGQWSGDDIDAAVADALNARNDKNATVATFGSEIKRCCRARVREHIGRYFTLAHAAWDAEGEAAEKARADKIKGHLSPLRAAFTRCYHFVVLNLAKEAAEGRTYATAGDMVAFALKTLRERQVDYKRVAGRLAAIRKELQAFADNFPVEGITTCVEFLAAVSAEDLKRCRHGDAMGDGMGGATGDATGDAMGDATGDDEIAEGAFDMDTLLDNALGAAA